MMNVVVKTRSKVVIVAYTHGSGSGHLTRINAIYRGFEGLDCSFEFFLIAPRSKYILYKLPGVQLISIDEMPAHVDIFICDWRFPDSLFAIPQNRCKIWFGICRLGRIPRKFPKHFHTIGIEPGVKANSTFWPIISTFKRDLLSRDEARRALKLDQTAQIAFVFENGCYSKHVEQVFEANIPAGMDVFRSTCNTSASTNLEYGQCYPIAKYLNAADFILSAAGYNVMHEVRTLAPNVPKSLLVVGGDDQHKRAKLEPSWPVKTDSAAQEMAQFMLNKLRSCEY